MFIVFASSGMNAGAFGPFDTKEEAAAFMDLKLIEMAEYDFAILELRSPDQK